MIRRTQAVYVISVAAELAGMHPQTLRIYERRGLVNPARTQGGNRRYSDADIEILRRISELAESGMNLEGIRRVMELEVENARLRDEVIALRAETAQAHAEAERRGLVRPARTEGGNRRYSDIDIERLRRISELAAEGMNLEGIRRVMELELENERLKAELAAAKRDAEQATTKARDAAQLVPLKQALAVFGERPAFLRQRDDQSDD